jgi:hypothetical protein
MGHRGKIRDVLDNTDRYLEVVEVRNKVAESMSKRPGIIPIWSVGQDLEYLVENESNKYSVIEDDGIRKYGANGLVGERNY